jgi:hypothetical protein
MLLLIQIHGMSICIVLSCPFNFILIKLPWNVLSYAISLVTMHARISNENQSTKAFLHIPEEGSKTD